MRIDHHAYQRATRVAGLGLLQQLAIGLLLLAFGIISHDSPAVIASTYALAGVLLWLGLIIIFHQHKLERLEALEEDELSATRGGAGSFFEKAAAETRVAARRLALMHKWLMPALSLVIALILAIAGAGIWRYMSNYRAGSVEFHTTDERGWAIAICLAVAAISFIFSRFVAGMAKQQAWQNLRGGAAYMVGNALVMIAIAAGIIFRFFDNESVIRGVAWAIAAFMFLLVLEIVLNFILNLYRPRVPGEVPRPAFDSKILSLFATPDSIVRSLNEAVNYQFGFDVTSSWGYQLLLRSFVSLLALGVIALVVLSMIVVVEPHQQAVRLRGGAIVRDAEGRDRVYSSGVMWKWPWPIESAQVYDVTRVRSLYLTARVLDDDPSRPLERQVNLWDKPEPPRTDVEIEPFVVGSPALQTVDPLLQQVVGEKIASETPDDGSAPTAEDVAAEAISDYYSLVDAEIVMQYRVRSADNGLLDYLQFAPETIARRQSLTDRERALRALALSEVSRHFARLSLDDVLSPGRIDLAGDLQRRIQSSFDAHRTGVEVLAVDLPMLRPSSTSAPKFEELNISEQARRERIAQAERYMITLYAADVGDAAVAERVLAEIEAYERLRATAGNNESPEVIHKRQGIVDLLVKAGGNAAQLIASAERDRWVNVMFQRGQAERIQSQLPAYRAAPELYRQRETMKIWTRYLPTMDKYIIAIDPSKISVDCDLKKISPLLEFAGASEEEKNKP